MRTSPRVSRITAVLGTVGLVLGVSACATGAPQNSASPASATSTSAPSSSAPSSSAPAPETTPAAPSTPQAPTNQPTVVYTKAASSVGPGEDVTVSIRVETPNPGIPFGDVALIVDGTQYAGGTLDAEGNQSFTINGLGPGEHVYEGHFAGNESYAVSASGAKTVTVLTAEQVAAAKQKAEEEKKAKEAAEKAKQQAAAAGSECPPTAEACIDLTNSTTWLQDDGVVTAGPYKQIAGRAGHRTPTGTFTVQWKDKDHKSDEFDQAPMPYSIFFTNTGVAFHVGSLSVPSHGCIHLSESAAKTYWDALTPGDVVYVFGSAPY